MHSERKGALNPKRKMGKGLYKVFKTVVKDISQYLPPFESDYPKGGKSCEISFTTVLNTLYKPLPIFCVAFNTPFHSNFPFLI